MEDKDGALKRIYFASTFVSFLRLIRQRYLAMDSRNKIRNSFKYSFLTRIVNAENRDCFSNSRFVKWLLRAYKRAADSALSYSKESECMGLIRETKERFFLTPTKIGGACIVATVSANIVFSRLLDKEIGLFGWITRGLFLLVGLSALFCNLKWEDLKKASLVLKLLSL